MTNGKELVPLGAAIADDVLGHQKMHDASSDCIRDCLSLASVEIVSRVLH